MQAPTLGFVGVDAQVDRLMANGKVPGNLLGAPVAADVGLNATPKTGRNGFGIAAMAGALGRFAAGLFRTKALESTATPDFTPNGAGVPPKQAGTGFELSSGSLATSGQNCGLANNTANLVTLFALLNLWIVRKRLLNMRAHG